MPELDDIPLDDRVLESLAAAGQAAQKELQRRSGQGRAQARQGDHWTPEQLDLAVDAALKRRRAKRWSWLWTGFWGMMAKAAIVVTIAAGLSVLAVNTGFCSRPGSTAPENPGSDSATDLQDMPGSRPDN